MVTFRSCSAASALGLVDNQCDVFDRGMSELIHHTHDRAVIDVRISLDVDNLLGFAFEGVLVSWWQYSSGSKCPLRWR